MSEEKEIEYNANQPEAGVIRKSARWLIILLVFALGVGGFIVLKHTGPTANKEAPPRVVPLVRVITVKSGESQMFVRTQGRVEPTHRTQVASEVIGRVTNVSKQFKAGGVFKHNEIMLEVDSADYVSAIASAEAALADANLNLEQEMARATQARRDWEKLGRGTPSKLVLREPQITSAKARVSAAKEALGKALRDSERTKIRAPYDCRVQSANTDIGAYVIAGAKLAELYSLDDFEIRMPVTMEDLGYLKSTGQGFNGSDVTIFAELAGQTCQWTGKIVRSEGNVDRNTMSTHLVMQVDINNRGGVFSLPPTGLVVRAEITGKVVDGVTQIPRSALRQDDTVLTLDSENKLLITSVKIARTMEKTVLVSSGLPDGTRVIVSPIEMPVNGMELDVENHSAENEFTTP